jgi:polyisoprenoid-binding protein YceI
MTAVQESASSTLRHWQIDKTHVNVEFAVRHLMISTVKGRFGDVGGTVAFDPADPSATAIEVQIPVESVDTRHPDRDAHLRSPDFLDAARYPVISFHGQRMRGDVNGTFDVIGDLTIHGVTREVTLRVVAEGRGPDPFSEGERAGFSATTTIDRRDFGLTWNKALETGGFAVGHEVKITIDLELISQ